MNPFFIESWNVLLQLAPWLLLGAAVAGLMHGLLPKGFVRRQLTGTWAVPKAVAMGVPLPLCSCGVIPAGLGLKKDGASDGAAIGFLIATPQTGVDSILVAASFLGWPFALWKVGSAAATGLVGGWVADRLGSSQPSEPQAAVEAAAASVESHGHVGWRGMLVHSVEMIRTIWGWLAFGVVASAAITVLVPEGAMASLAGLGLLASVTAVLAISVPLYVCATASVPIAAALVASGMPAGLALVFLMAGPATNVATIGAVKAAFGNRALVAYLGTIVIGSVGFGLAFDSVLGTTQLTMAQHSMEHAGPIGIASAVVLLLAMSRFAWDDLSGWMRRRKAAGSKQESLDLMVEGMTCNGCSSRLERVLLHTEGVDSAVISHESGSAMIGGTASLESVREAIEGAGFVVVR